MAAQDNGSVRIRNDRKVWETWVPLKPFCILGAITQVATECCRPPKLFWMSGYSEAEEHLLCLDNPYRYQRKELHVCRVHYCQALLPRVQDDWVYVVKQKCTTWAPIKFGVLVIIINKKYICTMTTKKNSPCLLSNNEPCYIASSLKQYLCKEYNIRHIFRAMGENQENTRPNKEKFN